MPHESLPVIHDALKKSKGMRSYYNSSFSALLQILGAWIHFLAALINFRVIEILVNGLE